MITIKCVIEINKEKYEIKTFYSYSKSKYATTKPGRPRKTYVKQICEDTGLTTEELKTAMKEDVEENV